MNHKAETIMLILIQIQNSLKISHWKTKLYSEHIALDQFLQEFNNKMDLFIETWQGKYSRIIKNNKKSTQSNTSIFYLNHKDLIKYLDVLSNFLNKNNSNKNPNPNKNCKQFNLCKIYITDIINNNDTDLLNIRDDILSLINKLKYLLTLK